MSLDELVSLLEYHNRKYWIENNPEISDADYDLISRAIQKLQPDHPVLQKLHSAVSGDGTKVRHREPMLSLDKAYSLPEVLSWAEKYVRTPEEKLLVEPKYDGISAGFDGRTLFTRGDGEFGEDITDKLPLIELESCGYIGVLDRPVRGELLIRSDDFATIYRNIRKKDGELYKNSRNAVAGIMGLKDISLMLAQHAKISLIDYNLYSFEVKFSELADQWENLKMTLARLPYPQDGIVIKLADISYRKQLGNTAHHPRGEIAYKFTNASCETTLLGVEWSFGKNCLTPVAQLEPVELSGITIRRASLHNIQNLLDMQIMIGDTVTVERAGDVIPYIVSSVPAESGRRSPFIDRCPSCGAALRQIGPELVCTGVFCPETSLQRLAAAVKSLGIEHLGEPTLRKLMDKCQVKHVIDLFSLTVKDVLGIDGFAAKSAANLVAEIAKARRVYDYQLLASLNIPHIGINMSRQLLGIHPLSELRKMSEDELSQLPGVGPERARFLVNEFAVQSDYLDELLSALQLIESSGKVDSGEMPSVCFTGKMPEKRSYYESLAQAHGYRPVDSVSSGLSMLVAADPGAGGGKLAKAAKLNIKVIPLDEFLAMVAEPVPENTGMEGVPAAEDREPERYETGDLFDFID